MPATVQEKLNAGPLFDHAIIAHHFVPYLRDYDLLVDVAATVPGADQSYIEGRYRYRFTHCVVAHTITALPDEVWRDSWQDIFIDYATWEQAGMPAGFVWGVCWAEAYPGLIYIEHSVAAQEWAVRLQRPMHEVKIETNAYTLQLVFHDVTIQKIAQADPHTRKLTPL